MTNETTITNNQPVPLVFNDFTMFQMFYERLIPLAEEYVQSRYWEELEQCDNDYDVFVNQIETLNHECYVKFCVFFYGWEEEVTKKSFEFSFDYLTDAEVRAEVLQQLHLKRASIELNEFLEDQEALAASEELQRKLYELLKQKFEK